MFILAVAHDALLAVFISLGELFDGAFQAQAEMLRQAVQVRLRQLNEVGYELHPAKRIH